MSVSKCEGVWQKYEHIKSWVSNEVNIKVVIAWIFKKLTDKKKPNLKKFMILNFFYEFISPTPIALIIINANTGQFEKDYITLVSFAMHWVNA